MKREIIKESYTYDEKGRIIESRKETWYYGDNEPNRDGEVMDIQPIIPLLNDIEGVNNGN
jgi:hypothetical protein